MNASSELVSRSTCGCGNHQIPPHATEDQSLKKGRHTRTTLHTPITLDDKALSVLDLGRNFYIITFLPGSRQNCLPCWWACHAQFFSKCNQWHLASSEKPTWRICFACMA